MSVFEGKEKGPCYDVIVLNSGFALYVADNVKTPKDGVEKAKQVIESGKAKSKLEELIECSNK